MDDYYEDGREIFDEDPDDKNGKKGGAAAKKAASGKKTLDLKNALLMF